MAHDLPSLIRLRHWLHAHPELSRQEEATARHLRGFLQGSAPPDRIVPLHGAGFAAVYDGRAAGRTVLLRCELDALPIHETNADLPYRSTVDGVGHKCGHDGHMAILAGVAQELAARPLAGRVVLLFQPDEETGTGARDSLAHPNFAQLAPDYAFALHNLPGYPAEEVVCRAGTFASEVHYAAVRFTGKEAHSALPETGASPAFAAAELTLATRTIQAAHDRPEAYALAVPVFARMGVAASGISPAEGEMHVTLRASDSATVDQMWQALTDTARALATRDGLDVAFEVREHFPATQNAERAVAMIARAADQAGLTYRTIDHPFRWGEDFGALIKDTPGAMFGLGAGQGRPDLHHADYDFPDAILPQGIAMFMALIDAALS
ncbi:amidohydrolase [Thalassorhabdomicrobium marinisediminis]|uniref:amidohydrolase n=1 Tax=Thalassorhabdomicrobium marinisediminis TaxID=2170577 RepID=UPI0024908B54|nr:amidohydrolase [Thalassorhabdomicrobium marinisediminis]